MAIYFIHRARFKKNLSKRFTTITFFLVFAWAMFDSIWSIYLYSFLHDESLVGFLSSGLTLLTIIGYFFFTPLVEKSSESKMWLISAFSAALAYLVLSVTENIVIVLLMSILFVVMNVLHIESRGILLRDCCNKKNLENIEGYYITIKDMGWVFGPLLAGYVASRSGIPSVFVFCFIFVLLAIAMFFSTKFTECRCKSKEENPLESAWRKIKKIFEFFENKERIKLYVLGGSMVSFWGCIYVFIPIYIIRQGLPEYHIGILLFSIGIPMILFNILAAKMVKRFNNKKVFMLGYSLLFIGCLIAFLTDNIYFILGGIFTASLGVPFIETPRETYFFKIVKRNKEKRYYGPYMTCIPFFALIGKGIVATLLIFFSFKIMFLYLLIQMLVSAYLASTLKG